MNKTISIFGLGYVGSVTAAAFAGYGHSVVGVDVQPAKVDALNHGKSPVSEPGVSELIATSFGEGRIRATTDPVAAVESSDFLFVCVGTPSRPNGDLDLTHVVDVAREIGDALRNSDAFRVVVVRSTVLPGTIEGTVIPLLEASSGKRHGEHFGVVSNPEFLREASALKDFMNPARTVIGSSDERSGNAVSRLYGDLPVDAPIELVPIRVAEMVKYVDNAFHATKVGFANEIGRICKASGIDGREVARIFLMDDKLNTSRAYLEPGNAFGGSCLPKDLRALAYLAKHADVKAPMLESVTESNEEHIRHAYRLIAREDVQRIGVLGLSFKAGTDDLRESPTVDLVERLIGKGYDVAIFDPHIVVEDLTGTNRSFIETEIPHIAELMHSTIDAVLERAEVVVVTIPDHQFDGIMSRLRPEQQLVDLVGVTDFPSTEGYRGVAW